MAELLGYQFDRTFASPIETNRQVTTINDRDNIQTSKRWLGMLVHVVAENQTYELNGGLTNASWIESGSGTIIGDSDDITEGTINLFMTNAEKTKLGYITVVNSIDLDVLKTDVDALGSGLIIKDDWDASVGTFPGGGSALIGWFYIVNVAGTVDGVSFAIGDSIIAKIDNASTTVFAANWIQTQSTSEVTSVVGLTGVISKASLLSALNVEDGAKDDMTGAEIAAAITSELGVDDWKTKLTKAQVLEFVNQAINAGTQTNIEVSYESLTESIDFTVKPYISTSYNDLPALLADQGNQVDYVLYEIADASGFESITGGVAWVRYKGTTIGDETDYLITSSQKRTGVRNVASVSTTQTFNHALYSDFKFTMTADTIFSSINLPTGNRTLEFTMKLTGEFVPTFDYLDITLLGDTYDGTIWNFYAVQIHNGDTEEVTAFITNM
jgi:hypothetical protein